MRVSTQDLSVIAMNKSNDKGGEAASEYSAVRGCPLAGMFYHRGKVVDTRLRVMDAHIWDCMSR